MKTMTSYLFAIALLTGLFSSHNLHAQKPEFGAKAGIQLSDISVSGLNLGLNLLDPKMTPGVTAGLYAEMPMGSHFFFAPEFNYTQKGFRVSESVNVDIFGATVPLGAEAITRLHYLEMPLMVKYAFGQGKTQGYLKAGPTVAYALEGNVTTRINSIVDFDVARIPVDLHGSLYNAFEVGARIGAGVEWHTNTGKFFVDASLQHGLTDLMNEPVLDLRVKNQALSLGVGYAVKF